MARISGLISGLDTDSLIQELVSAYQTKQESYVKKQTKLEWTQETWKGLNTKVYSFYTGALNSARFSSAYNAKKATISDSTKATVSASSGAVVGTQTLKVKSLAKTAYLTGGEVKGKNDEKLTGASKLSELKDINFTGNSGVINVMVDGTTKEISVNADTTINGIVASLKEAGLNANFDQSNQRLFVSAKESGENHSFAITAGNVDGLETLNKLGLNAASKSDVKAYKDAAAKYGYDPESAGTKSDAIQNAKISPKALEVVTSEAENRYVDYVLTRQNAVLSTEVSDAGKKKSALEAKVDFAKMSGEKQTEKLETMQTNIEQLKKDLGTVSQNDAGTFTYDSTGMTDDEKKKNDEKLEQLNSAQAEYNEYQAIQNQIYTITTDGTGEKIYTPKSDTVVDDTVKSITEEIDKLNEEIEDKTNEISLNNELIAQTYMFPVYGDAEKETAYTRIVKSKDQNGNEVESTERYTYKQLVDLVNGYANTLKLNLESNGAVATDTSASGFSMGATYDSEYESRKQVMEKTIDMAAEAQDGKLTTSEGAAKVEGQDAEIELNEAVFKSNTNNFSINGLTITATGKTDPDQVITINTTTDIDSMYDSVKKLISGYNDILKEMNTLYYADSSKGYEPLTDDEKDAMSDAEVEKWEKKIKDSLLRRDDTLSGIMSAISNSMTKSYEINGKSYSLSSFGIATSGYFSSTTEERGLYHIDGDSEDSTTSGNQDKLRSALASDPDTVVGFFQKIANDMYSALTKKMSGTSLRSSYTIYNDKQLKKQYEEYDDIIDEWDEKIENYTEKYVKQFTAMETALSKLQSSTSQLAGLLGS